MDSLIKVAAAQMDSLLFDKPANTEKIINMINTAANNGAKLVVFPECALTGYIITDRSSAIFVAETVPGPSTDEIARCCQTNGVYAVVGLVEKEGGKAYNA